MKNFKYANKKNKVFKKLNKIVIDENTLIDPKTGTKVSLTWVANKIVSIGFVFSGIVIVISVVFQALGQAEVSLIISFARQIIVLLPLAFILSRLIGLTGIWISFPISEAVSLIISGYFAIKVYRKKIKNLEGKVQVASNET